MIRSDDCREMTAQLGDVIQAMDAARIEAAALFAEVTRLRGERVHLAINPTTRRPIIWIGTIRQRNGFENTCVFASRHEAIRWVTFEARAHVNDRQVSNHPDAEFTFRASWGSDLQGDAGSVEVRRTEVNHLFDWAADAHWEKHHACSL